MKLKTGEIYLAEDRPCGGKRFLQLGHIDADTVSGAFHAVFTDLHTGKELCAGERFFREKRLTLITPETRVKAGRCIGCGLRPSDTAPAGFAAFRADTEILGDGSEAKVSYNTGCSWGAVEIIPQ